MSGHDSIVSPNLHYAGAAGDALDGGAQKRRREAGTWEGNNSSSNSSKRVRRDDFQVEAADSTTSQYSSPASLYDPSLSNHAFAAHSSTTSTPYPSNQPAGSSAVAFANAADSSFPHPNVDPAIQAYNPSIGPVVHQHQHQHPQQHQFRDSDAAFTAYPSHTANPQFASPWGMPPHPSSRPYHSSPDQFFPPPNDYASTSMPSQTSYQPSLSAQDWTQPSYSYTGGTEHWNYQIDEPTVYGEDASLHLKIQSIPTLDNLSTQIIMNLAKGSLPDIVLLTSGRNYEESQAYLTRRNLFDQTRKVFTRASVFIDLLAVSHIFTASQQEVIRKANRATFISSILEGHDISFYDLDARFLDTFVPTGQRLLKWQAAIFLDLKTQAYIAALMNSDGPPEVLLNELFPADLEQRIIARHPDAANIAPSEQDFLDRARARKQYLLDEPPYEALAKLRHKYGWQDFLREFATCINKNLESIINNPARTPSSVSFSPRIARLSQSPATRYPYYGDQLGQQRALGTQQGPPAQQTPQPQPANQQIQALQQQHARGSASSTPEHREVEASPRPKAKPAKPAKASGGSGTPRQPWKQEEEDALLAGLSEVKGPHWSQILSLYGRGGSVSEVLKDRNQIQLKDKARNLKLFYLKMGNEVPQCLRGVTGELRKRGGARIKAQYGLLDDDDGPPKKKAASSPLKKGQQQGGEGQSASNSSAATAQIDPSLSNA